MRDGAQDASQDGGGSSADSATLPQTDGASGPTTTDAGSGQTTDGALDASQDAGGCSTDSATFQTYVGDVSKELLAMGAVGAAVSIVCGGEVYAAGIGDKVKGGAAVDEHTLFNVGSTQKPFTAALAMRLVEEGTMRIDDPVSKWVSGINTSTPYTTSCTFAQLLSHTSGYPAVAPDSDNATTFGPFFAAQASSPMWSPPGALFNYSDDGFDLAGYMMQNAEGQDFDDLITAKLLRPAGMLDVQMDPTAAEQTNDYADGYSGGQALKPTAVVIPEEAPDTGAFASALDLAHFAQMLMSGGGQALQPSSVATMTTAKTPTDDPSRGSYGYGLITVQLGDVTMWSHDGENAGFVSDLVMFPEYGFAAGILVNSDSVSMPAAYSNAFQRFTGKTLAAPPGDAFDPSAMSDYVGTYESATLGSMVVADAATGGGLQITVGGKTVAMTPAWKDTFMFYYAPWAGSLELNFWRVSGTVQYAVTRAGVGTRSS
jgi:CubicO group peptidase (beta-lactamase class C family)